MAEQLAPPRARPINDALYAIARQTVPASSDVTQGNNDIGPFTNSDGQTYHVPGFAAGPGYDLASGLGTIDATRFVPALALAASLERLRNNN